MSNYKYYLKNLISAKTNRHIVAFFVDDYGSVRTKDLNSYHKLKEQGIPMDSSRYSKFDTLASTEDLEKLFDVLTSVKDKNGHYACMTPFANIANPNFEKIKESEFSEYHRESFVETLRRYGSKYDGTFDLWKQGISENIFHPEFHGTEHVNIPRFMHYLQSGHKSTRLAFENECFLVPPFPGELPVVNVPKNSYYDTSDIEILIDSISKGVQMFKSILGYQPTQFTPGASSYSECIESTLLKNGIKCINTDHVKKIQVCGHIKMPMPRYTGMKNRLGIKYVVRNCPFEPFKDDCSKNSYAESNCFAQINAAFRMGSPAIISSHRVNFVGELEPKHRDESLEQLKTLLQQIVKRWPDVEFVNGTQLCNEIL